VSIPMHDYELPSVKTYGSVEELTQTDYDGGYGGDNKGPNS
jgi:hypothetical protein